MKNEAEARAGAAAAVTRAETGDRESEAARRKVILCENGSVRYEKRELKQKLQLYPDHDIDNAQHAIEMINIFQGGKRI